MSKKTEFLLFIVAVLIFASGFSSMISRGTNLNLDFDITPTPTITVAPTPTPRPTVTPSPEQIVVTPEPTEMPIDEPTPTPEFIDFETDDPDILEILDSVLYVNDTEKEIQPDEAFVYTEEDAYKEILKIGRYYPDWNSDRRTLLYTDVNAIRTPEDIVNRYPWMAGIEIMHTYIYTNCVVVIYELRNPTDNYQLLDALDRRDKSDLPEELIPSYDFVVKIVNNLELDGKSEFEIVKTVNDYLVLNTGYDYHAAYGGEVHGDEISFTYSQTSSIDTPLDKHMAICGGYSRTFSAIMAYCGIISRTVTGKTEGGGHAWNQVKVDGEWYNMDVTWNDPMAENSAYGHNVDVPGVMMYDYFLLTDETMYIDHTPYDDIYTEKCTSDKGRQYLIDCYKADTEAEMKAVIERQKKNEILFVAYPDKKGFNDDNVLDILSDSIDKDYLYWHSKPELGYRLLAITTAKYPD